MNIKDILSVSILICTLLAHHRRKGNTAFRLVSRNKINISSERKPRRDEDKINIVLIDFGYNYLLNEKVGSLSKAAKRAQLYIAPEIQEDTQANIRRFDSEEKMLADVYSLGMIIVEMLSKKKGRNVSKFERALTRQPP